MRSRWFHRPFLHSPALGVEKKATWLELFFDLTFVAAFIQLGNGLADHITPIGLLAFGGTFVSLWVAWTGFTFFENRYTVDDFFHRTVVLLQMLAVAGMALSAASVLDGETLGFSVASGGAQLAVSLMYLRASVQVKEACDYSRYWGSVFFIGSLCWFGGALVPPEVAYFLWGSGTLAVLSAAFNRRSAALAERFPIDFHHLGERYALLTLIVLGESFVKVLSALVSDGAGLELFLQGSVALLLTCGIWWVYFDDIAGSHIRKIKGAWIVWVYAHLPLQMAITASAVAVKKAVHFSSEEPAPDGYRWLLCGSLALIYFSVAAIDSVTERRLANLNNRLRVNARWTSALLLLVLAPAGNSMSGAVFLALVLAINIAQVFFDMVIAPEELHEQAELGKKSVGELALELKSGAPSIRPQRVDVSNAVRKGVPTSARRDLYFYLMEGSWPRVFVAFGFLFIAVNVFFAALYAMEPGSILNAKPSSFADAFYFSVQTMGTIGYGTLSPGTDYANVIVTIQAAVTVIGLAIVTGLVFAKASRPKATVLFSAPLVLTRMNGKPALLFRAGNGRGNEIVDANMTLVVLRDEITKEGHHTRRLIDLQLRRARSPMFILTWLAVHELDENSPLADVDWTNPEKDIVSFVVTLIGHDGTYGQTIYARHVYYPEDIRQGHRFVDVISLLPDGRFLIDYEHFHDTIEDGPQLQDENRVGESTEQDATKGKGTTR